jgi:molybdopterin-binding protein
LASAFVLVAAPAVQAANATNINVQLPAGFSIAGTIRDSAGAVLPDANIFAFGTTASAFGSTDSTGKYKVQGLNPGSYSILVSAPSTKNLVDGYYTTANANHFTPLAASATKVTVGPNKTGIDVKLPTGLTISGKITNTGGTALAGVEVFVSGTSYDGATTSSTGTYQLKGLAAGTYKMSVYAPDDSNYLSGYYTTANANRFTIAYASASGIVIGPSKTGVNVKLPTGYTISGTITNTSGAPLEDVAVQPSSTTYSGRAAFTDPTGKYTIKGLAAATYKLALSPSSDSAYMDGYYTTSNTNHFTSQISGASGVVVGPSKTGISAKIVTGRTISGKITNTAGTPLEFATVSASNLGHDRSAYTDASGNYTIRGLSSASQILQIQPPYGDNLMTGYYTASNSNRFTSVESGATALVVPPSLTGINVKVPAGYKISGKITGPGGVALGNAGIYAYKSSYSGYANSAADGTYTVNGLGSGTYTVQVYPPYSQNLQRGYYTNANAAHFTINVGSATGVTIGP